MLSFFLKSKLHHVRVTEACLDYRGSLTLDPDFLDASGIARGLGSPKCSNVVLFGAMTKALGLDDIDWERVIRETVPAKSLELNLAAYRAGRAAVG